MRYNNDRRTKLNAEYRAYISFEAIDRNGNPYRVSYKALQFPLSSSKSVAYVPPKSRLRADGIAKARAKMNTHKTRMIKDATFGVRASSINRTRVFKENPYK